MKQTTSSVAYRMNNMNFTTIVTPDHFDKALALLKSLEEHGEERPTLHTLVIGQKETAHQQVESDNFKIHYIQDLEHDRTVGTLARVITAKYTSKPLPIRDRENNNRIDLSTDFLRWALKPSFTRYIKSQHASDKIIYLDSDLFFYNNYKFLIDQLNESSVTLSPHWRNPNAGFGREYRLNQIHGLYNAGYIGFGKDSEHILDWWAELCCVECSIGSAESSFVDQKYLDAIPVYFDKVHIIRHLGCNVADWNRNYLDRKVVKTIHGDKVLINGEYEIIFIHYSPSTINSIVEGLDMNLTDHYKIYNTTLLKIRQELIRKNCTGMISTSINNLV